MKKITFLLLVFVLALSFSFVYADTAKENTIITPEYDIYCPIPKDGIHEPTDEVGIMVLLNVGFVENAGYTPFRSIYIKKFVSCKIKCLTYNTVYNIIS